MSTPANRLRDRWKGQRQSTNVEDRRGEVMDAGVAPSDSLGMRKRGPLSRPVRIPFGEDETKVPVEKARADLARAYVSNMAPYIPKRRKRKVY